MKLVDKYDGKGRCFDNFSNTSILYPSKWQLHRLRVSPDRRFVSPERHKKKVFVLLTSVKTVKGQIFNVFMLLPGIGERSNDQGFVLLTSSSVKSVKGQMFWRPHEAIL